MPTRAWVSPLDTLDAASQEFRCLVEHFPGDHFQQYGPFRSLLHWAAEEHDAQDFYIWNLERLDWDRPTRGEVLSQLGDQQP